MESVMELTARSSPRSTEALRAALRGLQADGITFAEISKSTEVHRTAISQLVNQGILPSPKHVASLWSFVDRQREAQKCQISNPRLPISKRWKFGKLRSMCWQRGGATTSTRSGRWAC